MEIARQMQRVTVKPDQDTDYDSTVYGEEQLAKLIDHGFFWEKPKDTAPSPNPNQLE